jgi:putative endopeptidase
LTTALVRCARRVRQTCRSPHLISPASIALAALLLWTIGERATVAQAQQDFLAANVDASVSPREDFFQYANGEWFKRNPMPDSVTRWGIGDVMSEEVDTRLRRIAEEAAATTSPRGSDHQLVGDLWSTGMDEASLNKQGLAPLQPDLERIGRVRSIPDLIDIVAVLHRRSSGLSRVLFVGLIEQDEKDSSRWIYNLQQGGIVMNAASYSTVADERMVTARDAFRAYLFKTFLRLHADSGKATASAAAVYDLEVRLAHAFEQGYGYQKVGLAELSRFAPAIGWDRYLRRVGVDPNGAFNMRSVRFFQTLDSLLRTIPLETWKDYLRLWLIRMHVGLLDDASLEDFFAYDSIMTGAARPRPRWRRVVSQARNLTLGQPLARLYLKEYFPATVNARYQAVAESMREAFGDRIQRVDWMSDSTKQATLRKLARLTITIGFGDTSMDFSTMPISRGSFVLNVMRANEWFHDQDVKKLNRPSERTPSDLRPSWNDGGYDNTKNAVVLSPGAVKVPPGWRVEQVDDAFLYGVTALGHEISHGFDSEGRFYDADGNRVEWWTPAEVAAFVARSQRLVDQYNEFSPLDGLHVDGRRSLRENMADFTGLRIALDAFKKTDQFRTGGRIGGFTPLQRFFLAFAYGYMSLSTPETLAAQLRSNYAPNRERVNGVLMNIPEFYEAFGIRPGDRMYRPEHLRAEIW